MGSGSAKNEIAESDFFISDALVGKSISIQEAHRWMLLGDSLKKIGEYDSAGVCTRKAFQSFRYHHNEYGQIAALRLLAFLAIEINLNYEDGQRFISEGIMLSEHQGDASSKFYFLSKEAVISQNFRDYENAHLTYQEMEQLAKSNSQISLEDVYPYMADLYLVQKDTIKAIEYLKKIKLPVSPDSLSNISPAAKFAKATYLYLEKDYESSIRYCQEAKTEFQRTFDFRWEAYAYSFLANNYYQTGRFLLARENARKGLSISKRKNLLKEKMDNLHVLYRVEKALGNAHESLAMLEQYHTLNQRFYSVERNAAIQGLQKKHERLSEKYRIKELKNENKIKEYEIGRQKMIILIFSIILIFGIGYVVFLIRQNSKRRNINLQLQMLSSIAEKTENFVIIASKEDRIEWVNHAFTKTFGYSEIEAIGSNPSELLSGKETSKETADEIIREVWTNKRPVTVEIKDYNKSGRSIWVKVSITPILDANGVMERVITVGSDITLRKEGETELIRSKELYEYMIENATDIIYKTDVEGNFTFINDKGEELLGYTKQQLLKLNFLDLLEGKAREVTKELFQEQINKWDFKEYFELKIRLSKEKFMWVGITSKPIIQNEQFRGFQGIARDITKRKTIELELRQNEERFRDIFSNSSDLIHVLDDQGKFVYVNEAWKEKLGFRDEEIEHLYIDQILHRDSRLKSAVRFGSQFAKETSSEKKSHFVTEFISKRGKKIIVLGSNIKSHVRNSVLLTGIFHDITSQKEMEAQLRDSLEKEKQLRLLKSKFISNASHEFRTPLTVIQTNVELLKELLKRLPEFGSHIERIDKRVQEEIVRMTNILDDLLALGKIESRTLEFEEVDIVNLIVRMTGSIEQLLKSEQKLEVDVLGKERTIVTDPFLLERVIVNLISNAVKYSVHASKPPEIKIVFSSKQILIKVIDYGIGIPADNIKNLFQPFYRADNVGEIKGTGLGLSIVNDYISHLNLKLDVESEENVGTTFTIII